MTCCEDFEAAQRPRAFDRSERIEDGRRPMQHVRPPLRIESDQVGDDGERQEMGKVGNGVEAAARHQFGDLVRNHGIEARLQGRKLTGLQRFGEKAAHGHMRLAVAAEHDSRRRRIHRLVHHAAPGRGEDVGVEERLPDRVVAGDRPGLVFRQPDGGARLAQVAVMGVGVEDDRVAPEIEVAYGRAGVRVHARLSQHRSIGGLGER